MVTGGKVVDTLVGIGVAIIGVAIVAVIVNRRSTTPGVITAAGDTLTNILNNAFAGI